MAALDLAQFGTALDDDAPHEKPVGALDFSSFGEPVDTKKPAQKSAGGGAFADQQTQVWDRPGALDPNKWGTADDKLQEQITVLNGPPPVQPQRPVVMPTGQEADIATDLAGGMPTSANASIMAGIQKILGGTELPNPKAPQDTPWDAFVKTMTNAGQGLKKTAGGIITHMAQQSAPEPNIVMGAQELDALAGGGPQVDPNLARNQQYLKPGAEKITDFRTKLSPEAEKQFQAYIKDHSDTKDLGRNDAPDYDLRGWWAAAQRGDPRAALLVSKDDGLKHRSDWWKTPYHQSFSADSQWASADAPRWHGSQLVDSNGAIVHDDAAPAQPQTPIGMMQAARENSPLARFGKKIAGEAQKHIRANLPNVPGASLSGVTDDVVGGLINMAPLMAATVVTKSAAPLLIGFGLQGYGEKYADSIAAGRTPQQADMDATFNAAAMSLPALLPVHAIMKPGQKFLGKVFTTAFSAAAQNVLTTGMQQGYDAGVLKDGMTWGQAWPALAKAGIIGGITGAALGAGEHVASGAAARRAAAVPQPIEPVENAGTKDATNITEIIPAVPPVKIAGQPPIKGGKPTVPDAVANPVAAPEAVHDPVTWAQTGWKLPSGETVALDDPRATVPQPTMTDSVIPPTGDGTKTSPVDVSHPDHIRQATEMVNTEPSDAQKEAGNYQKGHIKVQGIDIAIENPEGSERSGIGPDGEKWSVQMPAHYGYIKRTTGADKEQVDVYVGPDPVSKKVFVVDQKDAETGAFDEHKVMLGYQDVPSAKLAYLAAFSDGKGNERIGAIHSMTMDEFKTRMAKGKFDKPLAKDFTTTPGAIAAEHAAEVSALEAEGTKAADPTLKAAKDALASNIDPETGVRPKGARALREFRQRMQAVIADGGNRDNVSVNDVSQKTTTNGSRPLHEEMAEKSPVDEGTTPEGQGEVIRERLSSQGKNKAATVPGRGVQEESSNAPRGLSKASPGGVVVPETPSGTARNGGAAEEGSVQPVVRQKVAGDQGTSAGPKNKLRGAPRAIEKGVEGIDQTIVPGTARSARQLAKAREAAGKGKIKPKTEQKDAGGMFEDKPQQTGDMFAGKPSKDVKFSRRENAEPEPVFYSALTKAIDAIKQAKAPAKQWSSIIDNLKTNGVKQEEIDWSGAKDWLAEQKGPVSKADLIQHLRENEVQVEEVTRGSASSDELQKWETKRKALLPAVHEMLKRHDYMGFDSRDEARTAVRDEPDSWEYDTPEDQRLAREYSQVANAMLEAKRSQENLAPKFAQYTLPGGENYREMLLTLPKPSWMYAGRKDAPSAAAEAKVFRSSHWDEPNVLAHVRFDDRTGPNGEKVLHIAEVQSDMHQQGRRKGYQNKGRSVADIDREMDANLRELDRRERDSYNAGSDLLPADEWTRNPDLFARHQELGRERSGASDAIPDAPFKTSWHDLAMKRMLRYASEHGYDRLSWDTGETNADRYDLSKTVQQVTAKNWDDGTIGITVTHKGQSQPQSLGDFKPEKLPDVVGKDLADKIIADLKGEPEQSVKKYTGLDLKVGGEGMRGFYDKILPASVSKIVKKWGGKVETGEISSNQPVLLYEGPTPTKAQIQAVSDAIHARPTDQRFISPVTGKRLEYQINRVSNENTFRDVMKEMERGKSFKDAMEDVGSHDIAYIFGGDMAQGEFIATTPAHSVAITPEMREGASKAQPLFAKREGGALEGHDTTEGNQDEVKVTGTFSPKFDDARLAIATDMRKRLDAIGLKDIALTIPDAIKVTDGDKAFSVDGGYANKIMAVALDGTDHFGTMDHEVIHAIRKLGLFTKSEWSMLENRAVRQWRKKFDIDSRYKGLAEDGLNEEAIAEAHKAWGKDRAQQHGVVARIFNKMRNALSTIGSVLRGHGFKTPDSVFSKIASGEIGSRERAAPTPVEPSFARRSKEEEESRKAAPGIWEKVDKVTGSATEAVYHGIADAVDRISPQSVKDAASSIRMALTPMAAGSPEARAAGKDFANGMREARHITRQQFDFLTKNFMPKNKPDQLEKMWAAADEESVLLQQEQKPGPDQGLNRLTPEERAVVVAYQAESNAALKEAMDIGLFKGEGLPSYVPRMVVAIGADGKANRLGYGGEGATGLDALGRNLKTTSANLRQRKHLTTEETEEAAQHLDPNAMVVKDIRTLPLAMGRLREAIAGRRLINQIREIGRSTGETTVSEGEEPQDDHKWFTIDHPAFKIYRPKVARDQNGDVVLEGNKVKILKDEDGNEIFEKVPLFIRDDFEGPLRAVLSQDMPKVMKAIMTLKGKTMSVIMYSPAMHNFVIWGKAFPAAPLKLLNPLWRDANGEWHVSLEMYGRGRQAKNDPVIMKEAIRNGLDPIGHRFGITDATGIVDEPNLKPGRSWTSQAFAYIPEKLWDKETGDKVRRTIDKAGDVWHNKLLWDMVGDLQMGLYTHLRDAAVKHGADDQTAGRYAAHFANRYAGALPIEAMSKSARMWANMLLFSRSFTLTNLGAFKDLTNGLPKDVQAQILRDKGTAALEKIQGTARRKAASLLIMDIALAHVGVALAAYTVAWMAGTAYQSPDENEAGKENRFLIRYDQDGTAIYGRMPVGKVGEDLQDWALSPTTVLKKKLSPMGHAAYGVLTNDKGFGQKIYDPYDASALGYAQNAGRVAGFVLDSMLPIGPFEVLGEMGKKGGKGDARTKLLQLTLPFTGITVSKGAPGGPAMGQLYASKDEHEFMVGEHLPEIKEKIRSGDIKGATAEMEDLGISPSYMKFLIRITQDPGAKLSQRQLEDFLGYATPGEKEKMKKFQHESKDRAHALKAEKHSDLDQGDLKGALKAGDLTRFAAAGASWTRQEAIQAAHGAGLSATAAALRDTPGPIRSRQYQKSIGEIAAG